MYLLKSSFKNNGFKNSKTGQIDFGMTDDDGTWCPVTCPISQLDKAVKFTENTPRGYFLEGILHARTIILAATNGRIGA